MKFKSKILLSIFISVFLFIILSGFSLYNYTLTQKNFHFFKTENIPALSMSFEAEKLDIELTYLVTKMVLEENLKNELENYNQKLKRLEETILNLKKISVKQNEKDIFEKLEKENTFLVKIENAVFEEMENKKFLKAKELLLSKEYLKSKKEYSVLLNSFYKLQNYEVNFEVDKFISDSKKINSYSVLIGILLGIISMFIGWKTYTAFTTPMDELFKMTEEVLKGNLNYQIREQKKDEFGELTKAFNKLMNKLNSSVNSISLVEKKITSNSTELSKESKFLSILSEKQLNSSNEITNSVSELNSKNNEISDGIQKSNSSVKLIHENIISFNSSTEKIQLILKDLKINMNHSKIGLNESKEDLKNTLDSMNEIKLISSKINEFINIISDISDRTNLLSLNASIEAARAGEFGRGFAIVASEITKLAENTLNSVSDVKLTVKEIQSKIEAGNKRTEKIVNSIDSLSKKISLIDENSEEILVETKSHTGATENILRRSTALENFTEQLHDSIEQQKTNLDSILGSIGLISENSRELEIYSKNLKSVSVSLNDDSINLKTSTEELFS